MRHVLVHAGRNAEWRADVQWAAQLAVALEGSLTGVAVAPSPARVGMGAYGNLDIAAVVVDSVRGALAETVAAGAGFVAQAARCGVGRAHWQVAEGYVPQVLQQLAHWHDLLVLGRGDEAWRSPPELGGIVLAVDAPVVVVPDSAPAPAMPDCIAVAWNGAPEGLRALHAARPLLVRARRVVVLRGRRRPAFSAIGWHPPFALEAYFAREGLEVEYRDLLADDDSAGAALLDAAAGVDADLLVMGGYGRARFAEWVFGGATRHVLQHARLPVLLRH